MLCFRLMQPMDLLDQSLHNICAIIGCCLCLNETLLLNLRLCELPFVCENLENGVSLLTMAVLAPSCYDETVSCCVCVFVCVCVCEREMDYFSHIFVYFFVIVF